METDVEDLIGGMWAQAPLRSCTARLNKDRLPKRWETPPYAPLGLSTGSPAGASLVTVVNRLS